MTRKAGRVQRHIEKKRQSVGDQAGSHHTAPRTSQEFARQLSFQSGPALVRLKHECETGRVSVSLFITLLNYADGPPREGEGDLVKRVIYFRHGRPAENPLRQNTAKAPRTARETAKALTLGNPVVRRRLQREAEEGRLHPAIAKWLMAYGERKDVTQSQRRGLHFVTRSGLLPWERDPLAKEEAAAIAAQEAQNKAEEQARLAHEQEPKGPVAGEQEAEEPEELEVYREKGDRG